MRTDVARSLGALLALLALAACTGSSPGTCTSFECRAPTCCGATCATSADCCAETVCSTDGRCIPSSCVGCGELGCIVDFGACTAECAPPASCGEVCGSDADCAAGTRCAPSVQGDTRCYPDACARCGGLTPLCQPSGDCSVECVPPARCGEPCASDASCGANARCYAFPSGAGYCVPDSFESACAACGTIGCTFHLDDCTVTCQEPDVPDGGASCAACCESCASDADCCAGSVCVAGATGTRCMPAACASCAYGCTLECP